MTGVGQWGQSSHLPHRSTGDDSPGVLTPLAAPYARLQPYRAHVCRSHPGTCGTMRRRIGRQETLIPHAPPLVLRLFVRRETTCGEDVPLNVCDPDPPAAWMQTVTVMVCSRFPW
jgi:hypothetical protein